MLLDLATLIKSTRLDRHLSQGALAEKIGVSRQAVKKWEDGDIAGMKLTNLMRVCEALELDPSHLISIARAAGNTVASYVLHDSATSRDEYLSAAKRVAAKSHTDILPVHIASKFQDLTEEGQVLAMTQFEIGIETATRLHGTRSKQTAA